MNRQSDQTLKHAHAFSSLANQVIFFMLCDCWFCPQERLTGLYSLLFYNIFGYLARYMKLLLSIYEEEVPFVATVSRQSNVRLLAFTATKLLLDFIRAVSFVITGVFMLIMFGLEQGMQHFHPKWLYITITLLYYILTEKACQEKAPHFLTWLQLEFFENMEIFWTPVILHLVTSLASGFMITLVWLWSEAGWTLILASCYINVFLGLKYMDHYWQVLLQERSYLDQYRYATWKELAEKNDVCAICLQDMLCARVTPCKHMFHGTCLRRSLKERSTCPICKQELM
ncbi:RING finger protein 145-like [Centruroides sculpturatus]|uniref:RING finger protein 145-like n=1 Tax=Centruroides sculpturatus TaxID=218467 RepID=UPI000C6DA9EA|nr:RING finger protein 145-like [Centruroides sculpturatus]